MSTPQCPHQIFVFGILECSEIVCAISIHVQQYTQFERAKGEAKGTHRRDGELEIRCQNGTIGNGIILNNNKYSIILYQYIFYSKIYR